MSETNNSYKIYASKDYVDERALPQDAGEYKQLVTGADGEWKVEERLGYKAEGLKEVMTEQTLTTNDAGSAIFSNDALRTLLKTVGTQLNIVWNGENYSCTVFAIEEAGVSGAGNWYKFIELQGVDPSEYGFTEDAGEPFFLMYSPDGVMAAPIPPAAEASFTLAVLIPSETIHLIDPDFINLILPETTLVATHEGSGSGAYHYATFDPFSEIEEGELIRLVIDGKAYNTIAHTTRYREGENEFLYICDVNTKTPLPFNNSLGQPNYFRYDSYFVSWVAVSAIAQWDSMTISMYRMTPADLPGPIPAEYITGAPLTDADNGKVLGVVEGSVGLVTLTAADVGAEPTITTLDVAKGGTGYNTIADTTYTTARYRASALAATETDPTVNGVINWMYE